MGEGKTSELSLIRARARSSPTLCHFIKHGVADDRNIAVGINR
jgi:hypothetical protein